MRSGGWWRPEPPKPAGNSGAYSPVYIDKMEIYGIRVRAHAGDMNIYI